jgi:two-component system KDP operon response regulator KdpE
MEPEQKKVLIVEDDAPLRRVLVEKLNAEHFEVFEASDGFAGLEVAFREHPHVILLDIFMPKMDGISMLGKLRSADEWGKNVCVLVLTNSADAETIAETTGFVANDFLIKSEWSLDDLVGRIRKEVQYKKEEAEDSWVNPAIA